MTARFWLLAGPTASGKSGLALAIAEKTGAPIINADSMQVYADLSVLTARPTDEDVKRAHHGLYGHIDAAEAYSVGRWRGELMQLAQGLPEGPVLIVGGTGLYFRALTYGLVEMPELGPEGRARADAICAELGVAGLRAEAERLDPVGAARVLGDDVQRLTRLVAVASALGRPLSSFQAEPHSGLDPAEWRGLALLPEREASNTAIAKRAEQMIDHGGVDEALALTHRGLSPSLPAMKALGVTPFAAFGRGELTREEALERITIDTRQYAKRQRTWFRNQTADWPRMETANVKAALRVFAA